MITEEMMRNAAVRSCEIYTAYLERGYDGKQGHVFSQGFEKKIRRLQHRAEHPALYRNARRAAAILLAALIGAGTLITVNPKVRAAFVGWMKELYEDFFVYRFDENVSLPAEPGVFEPSWVPEGYVKHRESDSGSRISIVYKNEQGESLRFNYIYEAGAANMFVDAQGATVKRTTVFKFDADMIVFEDSAIANSILWVDQKNRAFQITGFLTEGDLLRVANSIYEK